MRVPVLKKTFQDLPRCGYYSNTFAHDLPQAKGPVDVIYIPPRSGLTPQKLIVFLPGNPGLIGYYTSFFTSLHPLISPTYGIIGLSHLGQCPSLPRPSRPLTLLEQAEAKCEFIQTVTSELKDLKGYGDTEVQLMGHSVGSYLCTQVLRRLEESEAWKDSNSPSLKASVKVSALYLLFPTVANIARSPNGIRLRPMFHFPLLQLLPMLAYLLKPIIYIMSLPIFKSRSSSVYAPNATTLSFLNSPPSVRHILNMARSEMETILEPDMEWYSRPDVRERIWAYFGREDGWVGTQADGLKEMLRRANAGGHVEEEDEEEERQRLADEGALERLVDCVDGLPHAFCLAHSDIMANKVAQWINKG